MVCGREIGCGHPETAPPTPEDENKDGEEVRTAGTHHPHAKKGFWFRYATAIVEFPIQICIIILMLTLICGTLTYIVHGVPSFEEPRKGFETRGTEVGKYLASLTNLWMGHEGLSILPGNVTGEGQSGRRRRNIRGTRIEACPDPSSNQLKVVFEAEDDSEAFSARELISVCQQEQSLVRDHPEFSERCIGSGGVCCPSWSLGYAVALMNNKSSCMEITDGDVEHTQQVLDRCRSSYKSGLLDPPFDDRVNDTACTEDDLVYTILHYLTPSSHDDESRPLVSFAPVRLCYDVLDEGECEESLKKIYQDNFDSGDKLSNEVTEVVAVDFDLKFALFDQFLVSDFLYVLLGALSAFVIIWLYTHSVFITFCAILNMIMSLVMAAFIYFIIFRLNFFPFVNVISAVLIIGIGADDTFVYMDLFRAAQKSIGAGNHNRILVFEETCMHAFSTMFVTSFTTSSALFATMLSDITAIKCFAAFAGSAILINFVYTITWLPAVIVIHDRYFSIDAKRLEACSESQACCGILSKAYKIITKVYHSPNRFFESALPKLIWTLRFPFIILFLAIGIGGFVLSFVTPRLGLPEKNEFQLFRNDHLFEQYDQVYRSQFDFDLSEKPQMPIFFIWGLTPVDTGNYWDPENFGELRFDPSFDISSPDSQQWLYDFCARVKNEDFIDNTSSSHFCFMDTFRTWLSRPCSMGEDKRCCGQMKFPLAKEVFDVCVQDYWQFSCSGGCLDNFSPGLRFDESGRVSVIYLAFQSSVSYSLKFSPIDRFWKELNDWTKDEVATAPSGLDGGWSVSQIDLQMYFYDLQAGIASGTATSITLSLAMASVVLLLSTRNVVTTILAMLTISCSVFTLIGVLVLLGWELNVFESAILSLAVGLSVDFTIHYGVAFRLAPFHKRKDRAIYAIKTLSSAITVAAISTFSAGAFMLPATVINYVQLGSFLTLVMSISWFYSSFFFLPLCMVMGPNHNCGQVPTVHCRKTQTEPHGPLESKEERYAVNGGDDGSTPANDVEVKVISNSPNPAPRGPQQTADDTESSNNRVSYEPTISGAANAAYEPDDDVSQATVRIDAKTTDQETTKQKAEDESEDDPENDADASKGVATVSRIPSNDTEMEVMGGADGTESALREAQEASPAADVPSIVVPPTYSEVYPPNET